MSSQIPPVACPGCSSTALAVERTKFFELETMDGGMCECGRDGAGGGEHGDLAWRTTTKVRARLFSYGSLDAGGIVRWMSVDERVEDEPLAVLEDERWCEQCAEDPDIEVEHFDTLEELDHAQPDHQEWWLRCGRCDARWACDAMADEDLVATAITARGE